MLQKAVTLAPGDTNAVGRMLGLLGDEWNLLILQQALMDAHRYSHFATRLPISNAVLTKRLRALVSQGLLTTDYRTTSRSRSLWPMLLSIWEWELTWVTEHRQRLPLMRHERCGEQFSPMLRCENCRSAVSAADVDLTPGPSGTWERSAPSASTRRRHTTSSQHGSDVRQAGLFPETMSVLGNRWSAALLVAAFLGATRFTDFQSQLHAPPSVLSQRLQTFCRIGVLALDPEETSAYLLTDKGRAFFAVLAAGLQWAQRWYLAPEGPAMVLTHRDCGAPFTGEWCCTSCTGRLRGAEVLAEPLSWVGGSESP